jgi:hypothetical protein
MACLTTLLSALDQGPQNYVFFFCGDTLDKWESTCPFLIYAHAKSRASVSGFSWNLVLRFQNLSTHWKLDQTRTVITNALHEDLYVFIHTSQFIRTSGAERVKYVFEWRMLRIKSCRVNGSTCLCISLAFFEISKPKVGERAKTVTLCAHFVPSFTLSPKLSWWLTL